MCWSTVMLEPYSASNRRSDFGQKFQQCFLQEDGVRAPVQEAFSKTTSELNLKWSEENPVNLFEKLKLPQFEIKSVNTSLCSEKFHIGEYSCLKAEFNLQRSIGFHLVQSYLPTILIVVISWVSFWLDVEAIPARITLGVTTLLTISSKSSGIQSNLPPVSYVKAIDVWMGACTTFVFTALLEFTLVNYLWRKRRATPPSIKVADENISLRMYEEKEECNGTKKVSNTCFFAVVT
ncbi:Glutamate-gated chloride channel [Araneus ventricosus]|uniref:Glutamate-gated chloride channel n=1 Tax=Araneus ventricosus TaxID=182803 RepID=A0A4Y1ZZW4_ARAVE|nr:Glutamate-gated chloride channel [Araneus ventricosus]